VAARFHTLLREKNFKRRKIRTRKGHILGSGKWLRYRGFRRGTVCPPEMWVLPKGMRKNMQTSQKAGGATAPILALNREGPCPSNMNHHKGPTSWGRMKTYKNGKLWDVEGLSRGPLSLILNSSVELNQGTQLGKKVRKIQRRILRIQPSGRPRFKRRKRNGSRLSHN